LFLTQCSLYKADLYVIVVYCTVVRFIVTSSAAR